MHFDAVQHTTNPASADSDHDSSICTAWPFACYCCDREWTYAFELNIDINMNLQFQRVVKKSLQQNVGYLPLVPYCTNQRSKHLYSFLSSPIDCILTKRHHKTEIETVSDNLRWQVQLAPNVITQGLNLQQKVFEKSKSRKWKSEWKMTFN
jgi:hypothetical protein